MTTKLKFNSGHAFRIAEEMLPALNIRDITNEQLRTLCSFIRISEIPEKFHDRLYDFKKWVDEK